MYKEKYLLFLMVFFFSLPAICQTAYENTIFLYESSLKNQKVLYNGVEHIRIGGLHKGHPYFLPDFSPGTVNYDDEDFKNVLLLYDTFMDELIINHKDIHNSRIEIQIFKERIKDFRINDHYFIKINPDTLKGDEFTPGFYEVLHNGNTKLFEKHTKVKTDEIDDLERKAYVVFTPKNFFIIYYKGKYYQVRKKSQALKILKDKKKELLEYYKNSGLKYRKDPETVLNGFVKVYDDIEKNDE